MKNFLGFFLLALSVLMKGQTIPVELMVGHSSAWYQHTYSRNYTDSRLGFFNTSSVLRPHESEYRTELMSQSYLTIRWRRSVKAGLGLFYASVPGLRPSFNLQFFFKFKNGYAVLVPRVDLCFAPSHDLMFLTEYMPPLSKTLSLHVKFQTMLNYSGLRHNRSYQNIRLGIQKQGWQTGIALNLDAFGSECVYRQSLGIYVKKDLP